MFARSLTSILKDSSLLREEAYISGKWCNADSGQRFEVTNPATGEVIAHVADLGVAEFKAAFETAQVAQKEWAEATGKERAGVLRRLFELVMANQEDLAKILTAEVGRPLAEARGEIAYGASYIEWFGEEAKRIYGDTIPGYERDKRLLVLKQPVGVVAAIASWNFPSAMVARKFAPALAAGAPLSLSRRRTRHCQHWH